jgi:hypothetical protein
MKCLLFVTCLLLLRLPNAGAQSPATPTPTAPQIQLDADCIRFDNPNAVVDGEIVYTSFTVYTAALQHAVDAWSPARGFAIPLREADATGEAVPPDATLIYRDVRVPGSAFKGVTVTWSDAPATITLNRAALAPPETTDPQERETILAVMAHETGHALGLGDVPRPGVTIRECANMLMKRSVDKGGGAFTAPQPGDIALYCLRWGGSNCGDSNTSPVIPMPATPSIGQSAPAQLTEPDGSLVTYRVFIVTCEERPPETLTAAEVAGDNLPTRPPFACNRAPAGVLVHVHRDDGVIERRLSDRNGEITFQKPDGIGVDVDLPQGGAGRFPSLIGYRPAEAVHRIPAYDPACVPGSSMICERVYLLLP